jgi:NADH-quinone oxidoreductase subunit C
MQKEFLNILKNKFPIERSEEGLLFIKVKTNDYLSTATYLAEHGFKRLLTVSAVDWIKKTVFEVYFVAHNFDESVYIKVSTEIPRDDPKIPTISSIWKNASMHERETWELFGIKFDGNHMLKPLFLEDWKGPPPFKKDFDWREYVKKNSLI